MPAQGFTVVLPDSQERTTQLPVNREPAHKRGQQRTLGSVYSAKGALKLEPDHSKVIKPPLGKLHEQ